MSVLRHYSRTSSLLALFLSFYCADRPAVACTVLDSPIVRSVLATARSALTRQAMEFPDDVSAILPQGSPATPPALSIAILLHYPSPTPQQPLSDPSPNPHIYRRNPRADAERTRTSGDQHQGRRLLGAPRPHTLQPIL